MSHFRPFVFIVALLAGSAAAQSLEDKVDMLLQQNRNQQAEIDRLKSELSMAHGRAPSDAIADEINRQLLDLDISKEAISEAAAASAPADFPKWLQGLVFKGDVRVRYEGQFFEDNMRYPEDRNRGRFRLRFGFDKSWGHGEGTDKDWKVSFRLASGGPDPTSTNQSFDGFFTKKPLWIDRAYVKWAPKEGLLKGLEIMGGKFGQQHLTGWQHWDTDVNLEGVYEKYTLDLMDGALKPYANFGQYFVNENSRVPDDTTLLVYGGGVEWLIHEESKTKLHTALNFYDYTHVKDNLPPGGNNPTIVLPDGRTVLAAEDFDILDFAFEVTGKLFDIDYKVYGDFGWNLDVDTDNDFDGNGLADDPEYDETMLIGLKLGRGKKKGDITLDGGYLRNEPNAVYGYFADSDIGMADTRAGFFRAYYNLTDFAKIGGTYMAIDTSFFADDDKDHKSLLQLDVSLKF